MISFKTIGAVTVVAIAALTSPFTARIATANPISFYVSTDGVNYTQFGTTSTSGVTSPTTSGTYNGAAYSINASATGSPILDAPAFTSTAIGVLASGAGTFYVKAEETDLTTPNVTGFSIGFTNNSISTVDVTESFTTTLAGFATATATLAPNMATSTSTPAGTLSADYTIDEIYKATFTAGGIANATIGETPVPEPISLALLGTGLTGIGLVVRRFRKSV